jgi:aconitate hydratase
LDGNPATHIFLASPETVVIKSFAGNLDYDPSTDSIETENGPFKFQPPTPVDLPSNGYLDADYVYTAPPIDRSKLMVEISPTSDRIQKLEPFKPWNGADFDKLPILIKVEGKCTTDHITPAGRWFRYRYAFILVRLVSASYKAVLARRRHLFRRHTYWSVSGFVSTNLTSHF